MVNTRLLVHAGARSNLKDDEHYVVQAEAYAIFDSDSAFRRHPRTSRQQCDHAPGGPYPGERPMLRPPTGLTIAVPDVTVYVEDTQLAYAALESQLPSSAFASSARARVEAGSEEAALGATTHTIDHAINTTPRGKTIHLPAMTPTRSAGPIAPSSAPISGRSHSWPGSVRLSQSSYLVSPDLARSSKRRRLDESVPNMSLRAELTAQTATQSLLPSGSPAMRRTSSEGAIREERTVSANGNFSELPTSYSISDEALESLKRRSRVSPRSAGDPGPQSLSPREGVRPRAASQHEIILPNEPAKTSKHTNDVTTVKVATHLTPATKAKPTTADSHQLMDLQSLSLVIHPPNVAAGQQFRTHVTPTLQRLVEGEVAKCFKPTFEFRAIDDLERGHWRMEIPKWPFEQLAAFWRTLECLIGSGNAGWGVWCSREPDIALRGNDGRTEGYDDMPKRDGEPKSDARADAVRVYCWGEVAKHIYLLLYVASNSKVRKLGLQWLDSQGIVVIQMPASKNI